MARLIDADILKEEMSKHGEYYFVCDFTHEMVDTAPTVEAIPKAEYEARLKADLVDILRLYEQHDDTDLIEVKYVRLTIQQKINALKMGGN